MEEKINHLISFLESRATQPPEEAIYSAKVATYYVPGCNINYSLLKTGIKLLSIMTPTDSISISLRNNNTFIGSNKPDWKLLLNQACSSINL